MNRKEKTIIVTILANGALVGLKFLLAASSGSVALRASAWHSVGDVFVSVFVLAGLLAAGWEARRRLQAGTIENVIALIVSVFMLYAAFDIFRDITGIGNLPDLRNIWPVTAGAFLTIALTYFTARYKDYVGRATNSISLVASGYHSRMDLYASVLVVVGLVAAALGLPALDRVAGMVVILLILVSSWEIADSAIRALKTKRGISPHEEVHAYPPFVSRRALKYLGGIAVLFLVFSSVYTVPLGEQAVVQRFGKIVGIFGPGLHVRIPVLDRVTKVATDAVQQLQIPASLVLTGDTSLIKTQLAVQYVIIDPGQYLFSAEAPDDLLAKETETAFRQAVSARSADDVLAGGRDAILAETLSRTQELVGEHAIGIAVRGVQLLSVTPPDEVADAFRDVASAREDKNTYVSEALAYKNETVAIARGDAAKQVTITTAEKTSKINIATGEAEQFTKKFAAYQTAPKVTRTRLYLEALEKVLPDIQKFILDSRVKTDSTELWITKPQITN